jgi:hypothetical protein
VLVGAEAARGLVRTVYEHAAEVPPAQRPSDERAWLFRLMVDVQDGDLQSAGAEALPGGEPSFTDDPFRREVAEQTAERMLPTAFAACSLHERVILAIDVLGDPPDEVLAAALDTTTTNARSVRDRARSSLRASLRDVLKGPERMLVDVALPEEALRDHLHDLLLDRFHPAPDGLHATVSDVLARARAERDATSPAETDAGDSAFRERLGRVRAWLGRWLSVRGLLGGLAFLVVVTAGLAGTTYFFSSTEPASPSPSSIVEFSVRHTDGVAPTLDTADPTEAAAHIRRTWGRRVSVPTISGASLTGVGRLPLDAAGSVPVLRYRDDDSGDRLLAYAFNYALTDALGDRATLDRRRRTQLAANQDLLAEQRPDQAVVLWRQRDDIFVLVAPDAQAQALRSRVTL